MNTKHDPQKIFEFIVAHKQANDGLPPSIRDIARQFNISSTSVVYAICKRLERAGLIRMTFTGIQVVGGQWTLLRPPGRPPTKPVAGRSGTIIMLES